MKNSDYRYQTAACAILFIIMVVTVCIVGANMAEADTRLTMGGGVYHMQSDREQLNEANYFVGGSAGPVFAATFVNSHGLRSVAAGGVMRAGDRLEATVYVGAVTGYGDEQYMQCNAHGICFMAAPGVSFWIKDDVALTGIVFGDAFLYGMTVRW